MTRFLIFFDQTEIPDPQAIEVVLRDSGLSDSVAVVRNGGVIEIVTGSARFDLNHLPVVDDLGRYDIDRGYGVDLPRLSGAAVLELVSRADISDPAANMDRLLRLLEIALPLSSRAIAVSWGPARCAMGTDFFVSSVGAWLEGGAFPALGLTSLMRDANENMLSVGLGFLTGQEVKVRCHGEDPASQAKIAMRVIDDIVRNGPIEGQGTFDVADFGTLAFRSDDNSPYVEISKKLT